MGMFRYASGRAGWRSGGRPVTLGLFGEGPVTLDPSPAPPHHPQLAARPVIGRPTHRSPPDPSPDVGNNRKPQGWKTTGWRPTAGSSRRWPVRHHTRFFPDHPRGRTELPRDVPLVTPYCPRLAPICGYERGNTAVQTRVDGPGRRQRPPVPASHCSLLTRVAVPGGGTTPSPGPRRHSDALTALPSPGRVSTAADPARALSGVVRRR